MHHREEAVRGLAVKESHTAPCFGQDKAAGAAAARYSESTDMEAVPGETGSREHICRYRRAAVPKKQPALHSLAQSSYAVAARTADTAAAAAARAEETAEDTHVADQPCDRS